MQQESHTWVYTQTEYNTMPPEETTGKHRNFSSDPFGDGFRRIVSPAPLVSSPVVCFQLFSFIHSFRFAQDSKGCDLFSALPSVKLPHDHRLPTSGKQTSEGLCPGRRSPMTAASMDRSPLGFLSCHPAVTLHNIRPLQPG